MKTLYSKLLCAAGMLSFYMMHCSAQTPAMVLKAAPANVVIDGQAQEWGDSLAYYNAENKIRYTIANDKDKLYLVVKVKDPVLESNILLGGLSFDVDPKGKKRNAFITTFPSNGDSAPGMMTKAGNESLDQKSLRAKYSKLKKIAVSGYRDVNEDYITTSNTYGIQVAMDYTADGYLVYEEAIPMELLHPGDLARGEWSFNIKLNGLEKSVGGFASQPADNSATGLTGGSRGGGGRGGSGGGRRATADASVSSQTSNTQITPTVDFWGRFSLAKN